MPRQVVNSPKYDVPVGGHFTQAVKAPARGTFVFVSGITARLADGTIVAEGDIEGQTRQVMENIKNILADAGASLDDVVRMRTYVLDANDIPTVSKIRREYFGDPIPPSTTVEVSRLFDPRQLIEIDVTAIIAE